MPKGPSGLHSWCMPQLMLPTSMSSFSAKGAARTLHPCFWEHLPCSTAGKSSNGSVCNECCKVRSESAPDCQLVSSSSESCSLSSAVRITAFSDKQDTLVYTFKYVFDQIVGLSLARLFSVSYVVFMQILPKPPVPLARSSPPSTAFLRSVMLLMVCMLLCPMRLPSLLPMSLTLVASCQNSSISMIVFLLLLLVSKLDYWCASKQISVGVRDTALASLDASLSLSLLISCALQHSPLV